MGLFSNIKKKISETVKKVKEIFVKTKPGIKEPEVKKPEPKPEPIAKPEPKIPYIKPTVEVVEVKRDRKKQEPPAITRDERKMLLDDFLANYNLSNLTNQDKNQIVRFAYDIGYRYYSTEEWYEAFFEDKDLTNEQLEQIFAQFRADDEMVDFSDASHFEDVN